MLLENIFATSLLIFLFMLAIISIIKEFNVWPHQRYDNAIMITMLLSGLVTIITACMWILRAWG